MLLKLTYDQQLEVARALRRYLYPDGIQQETPIHPLETAVIRLFLYSPLFNRKAMNLDTSHF